MKTIKYMRRLHKAGIAPALYPCTKEEAENSPYGVHDGEKNIYYIYHPEELDIEVKLKNTMNLNTIRSILTAFMVLFIVGLVFTFFAIF